ncbi:MAG: hypothetical protein AAF743_12975 [Planctomycetota bacterium]
MHFGKTLAAAVCAAGFAAGELHAQTVNVIDGSVAFFGSADGDEFDRDSDLVEISSSSSGSGGTSTGTVDALANFDFRVDTFSDRIVIALTGESTGSYPVDAAPDQFASINVATFDIGADEGSGTPIILAFESDTPLPFSIRDDGTESVNFGLVPSLTALTEGPSPDMLTPGLYQLTFQFGVFIDTPSQSDTQTLDWELVIDIPEPTSTALLALPALLLRRRR